MNASRRLLQSAAALMVFGLLSGCKADIPPSPVPQSKVITGVSSPCEQLTFAGFPRKEPETPGTFFVCRDSYALNWDGKRKTAEWVVERLTASQLALPAVPNLKPEDRPDPLLPVSAQTQINDYVGTGYRRVLLASPGNVEGNDIAWSHSYYLSNAVPHHASAGLVWRQLEDSVRQWTSVRGELVVITGTVYLGGSGRGWVGVPADAKATGSRAYKGRIQVPTHLFKVVIDPKAYQSVAFLVPNDATATAPLSSFMTTTASVEQATQLRFTPDLSLADQGRLKAAFQAAGWPLAPLRTPSPAQPSP